MAIVFQEIYDRLRGRLIVNMRRIDDEVIELPGQINEAIACEAHAMAVRDNAKNRLSFLTSQEQARLRNVVVYESENKPRKRTESEIKELAEICDPVQEAAAELDNANYELKLWTGITEGLRSKASSLKRLNELTVAGYISPSSFHTEQRAEMAARRKPIVGPRQGD